MATDAMNNKTARSISDGLSRIAFPKHLMSEQKNKEKSYNLIESLSFSDRRNHVYVLTPIHPSLIPPKGAYL